jgi:nucleotide-binding universal stress UspA family protein
VIERILVPLDGSQLANAVLQYAEELGKSLDATLHLLSVVAPPKGRRGGVFKPASPSVGEIRLPETPEDIQREQHTISQDAEMASLEGEVKGTLMPTVTRLREKGLQVVLEVAFGRPASSILHYAQRKDIDLILISTHGLGGPRPYAFGGTADRIARRSQIPVLLMRPKEVSELLPQPRPLGKD